MNPRQYPLCEITPALRIRALCSAFHAVREPQYSSTGELHDFWEAVFVLRGEAEITANDTIYHLKSGQMIFHPPMEFHRLKNASNAPVEILILSFVAARFPIKDRLICSFPSAERISSYIKKLRHLFVTRSFLLLSPAPHSDPATIQQTVNDIENYLLELLSCTEEAASSAKGRRAEQYATAIAAMHKHLKERLCANELALQCGMSVSTLQKLFLQYAGMGMMQYYHNLRMHHARRMLSEGKTVKETATALGFEDQNYFSTAYRRHFGFPPSDTRVHAL